MKRILLIAGTRPELLKLAPLYTELERRGAEAFLCLTGQHRELASGILDLFNLKAAHELQVMRENQALHELTARLFEAIPPVIEAIKPDIAVVQGDTTSAFVGATCGFYAGIPVAHVEAGMRTGDLGSPFPEEANRKFITQVAQWHFAATDSARQNLLREGKSEEDIFVTGNTIIDALQVANTSVGCPLVKKPQILVTGHRRESFGPGLESICHALLTIARRRPDLTIIYPVHPNPKVREPVYRLLGQVPNINLIPPVEYLEFVKLMGESQLIISDSGGIQEEAPTLRVPVVVTRDTTERMEAVESGWAVLAGTDEARIVTAVESFLSGKIPLPAGPNPFGDGKAAARVCNVLLG